MNIASWREVQSHFSPEIIGAIMSSYFGGRAEVHIRREITQTLYCDFASMYPTVCTLMGLWRFVVAAGMENEDATTETQSLLDEITLEQLRRPEAWAKLPVLVQILPTEDILPVRCQYGSEPIATIGVNYLSSDRPMWFTLADCIASKLLSGKAPHVLKAVRFRPGPVQQGLRPIAIAGGKMPVDASSGDFYKSVIDLRLSKKSALAAERKKQKPSSGRIAQLDAEQLALKILANATSYGIFIELNVEEAGDREEAICVHGNSSFTVASPNKYELPGSYFHPLLATLITGAARLMLAITERQAHIHGLDWAFCDTDSMAFAKPKEISHETFETRVRAICDWFINLNPYETNGSILKLEDQNFALSAAASITRTDPLFCFAISAKRYALFNDLAEPMIRKASAHGLGHLLPPYGNDQKHRASGVHVWQEDLWRAIIKAAQSQNARRLDFSYDPAMEASAASRYSITGPHLQRWFTAHNATRCYGQQVRPFNFFLFFYGKPKHKLMLSTSFCEIAPRRYRPVAPFAKSSPEVQLKIRDRETGEPVPIQALQTYSDVLRNYHIHPETKFLGGRAGEVGTLRRRHIYAVSISSIGKEADNWEEDEAFGAPPQSNVLYGISPADRQALRNRLVGIPIRDLKSRAGVSAQTIARIREGDPSISDDTLLKIENAVASLELQREIIAQQAEGAASRLKHYVVRYGMAAAADKLSYDPSNLAKIVAGRRPPPKALIKRLEEMDVEGQ